MAGRKNPDLRGQKFGKRTLIGLAPSYGYEARYYARCECGDVGTVFAKQLLRGGAQMCGSCASTEKYVKRVQGMVGSVFGSRRVLASIEAPKGAAGGRRYVMTECACGFQAPICASQLRNGHAGQCPSCAGKERSARRRSAMVNGMECQPCA